jgi:hypothetical protein
MRRMPLVRACALIGLVAVGGVGCRSAEQRPAANDSCIDEPGPLPAGERGPFPFENCRLRIDDVRPVRELDQEATVKRRQNAAKACCYVTLGNR